MSFCHRSRDGKVTASKDGKTIAESELKSPVLLDEVRAGGRIPLIVGRGLTSKAREALGLPPSTLFRLPQAWQTLAAVSLAQKMVAPVARLKARRTPGTYCEPKMTSVGCGTPPAR